jgi:hypothetical protein
MMPAMQRLVIPCLVIGCHTSSPPAPAPRPAPVSSPPAPAPSQHWELPAGWRTETIPFPLGFAPSIAHEGYEELRFPPGFFKPDAADYWSYAFIWRTEDAANLDAAALGEELTLYFRGLIAAVDDKQRITARDQIVARATATEPGRFTLDAHVFDAFKTAQPIDLVGWAERRACGSGALWLFVLAPATTGIRAQLDALAQSARC